MTEIPDSDSQEFTEDKEEALRKVKPKAERIKEPGQLPGWVKTALTKYALGYFDTLKAAAEDHGKAARTLYDWKSTPGAEQWMESVNEVVDDPVKFSENLLRGQLGGFTVDFMEMFQAAYEAGDYAEVRKFWESIADRLPQSTLKSGAGGDVGQANQIVINLPHAGAEDPVEVEPVEAEVIEPDD